MGTSVLLLDPVKPVNQNIWPGGNLKLRCPSPSNLANIRWQQDDRPLTFSARLLPQPDGLLILNASKSNAGYYRCISVERSKVAEYTTTVAEYQVNVDPDAGKDGNIFGPQAQRGGPSVAGLQAVVGLLVVSLLALLAWNFYKGHLPLPWGCRNKNREQSQQSREQGHLNATVTQQDALRPALAEDKPLVSGAGTGSPNNNHTDGAVGFNAVEGENAPKVSLPSLQFIDDESEI